MKKNKMVTLGICAAVLANIATTPGIALAEAVTNTESQTEQTEAIKEETETTTEETTSEKEETTETKPEVTPEVKPETTPEVTPETTPETTPEVTPEVEGETTPEEAIIVPEEVETEAEFDKNIYLDKATLVFQGVTFTYSEFIKFTYQLQKDNYTPESWDGMVAARQHFIETLGTASTNADLPNVEAAATAFSDATNALKTTKKTSTVKLEAAINAVNWNKLVKAEYTETSWERLVKSYKLAITVLEESKGANIYQEQVDEITERLVSATKALRKKVTTANVVPVAVTLTGDSSYVNAPFKVTQAIADGVTLEIWDVPAQAQNLYEYVIYVDGVISVTGSAKYDELTSITADKINDGHDSANSKGDTIRTVETSIDLTVTNNRTAHATDLDYTFNFDRYDYGASETFVVDGGVAGQDGVTYVTATYTVAGISLEYSEHGSSTDVLETLLPAKDSGYVFNYENAGATGRLTINFAFTTPAGVVDKSALEELVNIIVTTVNTALYTPESVQALQDRINEAIDVLLDPAATAEQVEKAIADLTAAFDGLVLINPEVQADKLETAELVKQIDIAKTKEQKLYTVASWGEMATALETAEAVLKYAEFKNIENDHSARAAKIDIDVTQDMVNTAAKNLETGIANLVLLPTDVINPEVTNPGSENENKPGTTDGNNQNNENNDNQRNQSENDRLAQTNVSLGAVPAFGGVGSAFIAFVAYLKGRKNKK